MILDAHAAAAKNEDPMVDRTSIAYPGILRMHRREITEDGDLALEYSPPLQGKQTPPNESYQLTIPIVAALAVDNIRRFKEVDMSLTETEQ